VTDRCDIRCRYCVPETGYVKAAPGDVLTFEEISDFVRTLHLHFGLTKVHITGGEPLVRKGIAYLVAQLAEVGFPDLALTTNGRRLAALAGALKGAGLRRVTVSLDTLNAATYRYLTRGAELQPALAGIAAAREYNFSPLKINAVILKGINDDEIPNLARLALSSACEVRFIELMPIGPAALKFDKWFVPADDILRRITTSFAVRRLGTGAGESSQKYVLDDGVREGVIGIISPYTLPFCADCGRLRLTATGDLIGCLGRGETFNVRPFLAGLSSSDRQLLTEKVQAALRVKKRERNFTRQQPLVAVGG